MITRRLAVLLCLTLLGFTPLARAEIHADLPAGASTLNGPVGVVDRQMLVNGISSKGRSWIVKEDLQDYSKRAIAASKQSSAKIKPRVHVDATGLTLVQFLPKAGGEFRLETALARVLIARPGIQPGETSVWEAEIPVKEMIRQARERAAGVVPGRDHPLIGAPAGSRRINVVEVLDKGYSYSAIYLAPGAPADIMQSLIARLVSRGATVDGQTSGPADARAALTMAGHRIDFSVIRGADTQGSRIVIQTDMPANVQARESR